VTFQSISLWRKQRCYSTQKAALWLIHAALADLGFFRLVKPDPRAATGGFTKQEWDTLAVLRYQTKSLLATDKEEPLSICGEQTRAAGAFGDIPVVVLSAGIQDQEEDPELDHDHSLKLKLQVKLAGLSTRGEQLVVDHRIQLQAPESIVTRPV